MKSMIPVGEAKGEVYREINGNKHCTLLFHDNEIERAEKIANALEGLSIESAQELLKKMDKYLLQTLLT